MQETEYINVYGARVHNLKDIDAEIPRNSLTVITDLVEAGSHLLLSIRYLQKDSAAILKLFRLMPATFWAIWSVRM